jgi:hypothetical protein
MRRLESGFIGRVFVNRSPRRPLFKWAALKNTNKIKASICEIELVRVKKTSAHKQASPRIINLDYCLYNWRPEQMTSQTLFLQKRAQAKPRRIETVQFSRQCLQCS